MTSMRENGDAEPLGLFKNSSNLFRTHLPNKQKKIDLSSFDQIIVIDCQKLFADVEGLTTYESLTDAALKEGCMPTVVPELKSITIGGALSGCGIEASSFCYGLVHETIDEIEVLLSDGRIVVCNSENEHSDLFFAFPNSYGTLGYALRVRLQLIPVRPFVKVTRQRFSDPVIYFSEMERLCLNNRESRQIVFIDGVIFDQNELYINTGEWVDEAPFTSNYRYMQIYYRSIQQKETDYLTTEDHIWRWDPDWFWCSSHFYLQNPIIRLLLGKFMLKSSVYNKIRRFFQRHSLLSKGLDFFKDKSEAIIQDVLIPIQNAPDFFTFFQREIGIKPIWICPSCSYLKDVYYPICPIKPDTIYLDFGFWDEKKTSHEEGYYNRKIEREVEALNGFKSLYSSSYYSEEEFWRCYDRDHYLRLKQKYDSKGLFGDLYQKCCTD